MVALRQRATQALSTSGESKPITDNLVSPTKPFSAEASDNAKQALSNGQPADGHPWVTRQDALRGQLDRLGWSSKEGDASKAPRVVIQDVEKSHGEFVTRTAVGPHTLAQGAETYLDFDNDAQPETKKSMFSDKTMAISDSVNTREGKRFSQNLSFEEIGALAADSRISSQMTRAAQLREIREGRPKDDRSTLANMSWGLSPAREMDNGLKDFKSWGTKKTPSAEFMRKNFTTYNDATRILGHPPRFIEPPGAQPFLHPDDESALVREMRNGYDARLKNPEYQAANSEAQSVLQSEVEAARKDKILVFQAAGNDQEIADRLGDPKLAKFPSSDVDGLAVVSNMEVSGSGHTNDAMARNSAPGDFAFEGTNIPVGTGHVEGPDGSAPRPTYKEVSGTSLSSPGALATAYAMLKNNPALPLDRIEGTLKDSRATYDLIGDRDSAGVVDPFAAIVLAKAPNASAETIEKVRALANSTLPPDEIRKGLIALGIQP